MSVTSVVWLGVCSVSSVHGTYNDTMYATRGDPKVLPCKLPVDIDPSTVVVRAKLFCFQSYRDIRVSYGIGSNMYNLDLNLIRVTTLCHWFQKVLPWF